LISRPAFGAVFTPRFLASAPIFNIYLLIVVSRLLFPQTILLSLQKNSIIFRATLIEWVANIALDGFFLYFFGMKGIAFATVIAYLIEKAILAYYCNKEGFRFADYVPVKAWILYSLATLCAFAISAWLY
jgi:Na+-driven multidrug efflux pump